jgi:hypothetical protein
MRLLLTVLALAFIFHTVVSPSASRSAPAQKRQSTEKSDVQRLEWRWIRPDGGYLLELLEIRKDGSLKAAYANPSRKIKVFRAGMEAQVRHIRCFCRAARRQLPGIEI